MKKKPSLYNGLVVYYKLDGDATDSVGSNDGTVSGATVDTSGKLNSCYSFDGTNDTIRIDSFVTGTNDYSISAWFNSSTTDANYRELVWLGTSANGDSIGIYKDNVNDIEAGVYGTAATNCAASGYIDGAWHHVVATFSNGNTVKLYMDGVFIGTDTVSYSIVQDTYDYIGSLQGSSYYWSGKIDEVGIWDRALSADEATTLYQEGRAEPFSQIEAKNVPVWMKGNTLADDIVSYYKFDGDATDAAGSNDGTVSGASVDTGGKLNSCYDFDGSNDYIGIPVTLSTDYSISLWINCDNVTANQFLIGGQATRYASALAIVSGQIGFATNASDGYDYSGTVSNDTWHHIVIIYNSSTNKKYAYIDTVAVIDGITPVGSAQYDTSYFLGKRNDNNFYYNGSLDEVGVWDRVISAAEVWELYNASKGRKYETFDYAYADVRMVTKLDQNLVAYYPLDGDANDYTGTYDGTVSGATSTTGIINTGYDFDGSNDYINLGDSIDADANSKSISIWFKADSVATQQKILAMGIGSVGTEMNFKLDGSNNLYWYYSDGVKTYIAQAAFTDTTSWHHAVLVYDSTIPSTKIYLDGALFATGAVTTSSQTIRTSDDLYLGMDNRAIHYFNGKADELGIWNKVLSIEEIKLLYNNGLGMPAKDFGLSVGLESYYKFDGDATDETGSHNGSVSGATVYTDGKLNQCYDFDGTNDIVTLGNLGDVKSFSFWFNPAAEITTSTGDGLFEFNGTYNAIYLGAFTGSFANELITFTTSGSSGNYYYWTTSDLGVSSITAGWHHVAVVWTGSAYNVYYDGVDAGTGNTFGSPVEIDFGAVIAGRRGTAFYDGLIDEIGFWNRALTSAEVATLYQEGAAKSFNSFSTSLYLNPIVYDEELSNGLVSYYNLDNNADDQVGTNNGTVTGATQDANGVINGCYDFDGDGDYIALGDPINFGTGSFTVSAWVNFESDPASGDVAIIGNYSGVSGDWWMLYHQGSSETVSFGIDDNSTNLVVNGVDPIVGQWYHVVGVRDYGNEIQIWINGVLYDSANDTVGDVTSTDDCVIGIQADDLASWDMDGQIDEIGIWNRALSNDEIKKLYNAKKARYIQ